MNEQELASKIVQHLNQGLDNLKEGTRYQLRSARKAALDRYRETPQPAPGMAWAGNVAFRVSHNRHFNVRNVVAFGMLLLGLVFVTYWQVAIQNNDIAGIDASLLSGDLPIDAYLDSDFEAWLRRSLQ